MQIFVPFKRIYALLVMHYFLPLAGKNSLQRLATIDTPRDYSAHDDSVLSLLEFVFNAIVPACFLFPSCVTRCFHFTSWSLYMGCSCW